MGHTMMKNPPTKYHDIIDSRDVMERIAELQAEDNKDVSELEALLHLATDAAQYASDWNYGEHLIRDSYFKTFAMEFAYDCDMIKDGDQWPYTCIDWDRAARELQMDYMPVQFDGVTYWVR